MSYTAFVFSRQAHSASRAFAEAIDADFYSVTRASLHKIFTIPSHKKYLAESAFALTFPVMKRKLLRENNKIVFRCNSNLFSDEPKRYLHGNFFVRGYVKFLLRNIDGIIAVSRLVQKDADAKCVRHLEKRIQSHIVYSFVEPDKWKSVKPALSTNNFLHIGYLRHHKGVDILLKAFEILEKRHSSIKLYLAGISEDDLRRYGIRKAKCAIPLGFTSNLKECIEKCAFYIATPRYEPGPTASLEAMAAGLIPIVNHMTGHKDHAEQLSEQLIINSLQPEEIAERIESIMKLKNRSMLSKKSRKIASKYSKETQIKAFKKAFNELTE